VSDTEIQAFLDKARKSLEVARRLLRDGYADFAASRAYYAMYYVAEALLLSMNQSYSKHSALLSAFGRTFARTGILDPKFHRWLLDAQDLRNVGDYEIQSHVPKEKAEAVCGWAQEFIRPAEAYLAKNEGGIA